MLDPHHRFAHVIARGSAIPPLDTSYRSNEFRVKPDVNLRPVAECTESLCYFRADAESMIVRSVASMICHFYSGSKGADIIYCAAILNEVGITAHLSHNPHTGLENLEPVIRKLARENCE